MTKSSRVENIKLELARGREAWEEARLLNDNGLAHGALSRVYYCAFHHVRAQLKTTTSGCPRHFSLTGLYIAAIIEAE